MNDELPEGWTGATLGAVADVNPRHPRDLDEDLMVTFVPMPVVSESDWKLVATKERPLREVKTGYTHFADGDVLFAKITPCMENGKAAVATELRNGLGCGTTELHVLRPHPGIDAKFLYHFIHQESFRREGANNFTGTAGQLRVPVDFMRGAEIPLAPTLEQRRIVAQVEALLAKARSSQDRLDKIPTIIKRFRQAVLAAACDGRLTHDLRRSGAGFGREVALGEIAAEIRTGPFGSALHRSDYVAGGVPVINPVNLVQGKIVPSAEVSVNRLTFNHLKDYALRTNDIIIARRGEMGRCALVTSKESGWLCGTGSAILRLKPEARPAYIVLVISSPAARKYLSEASVGTTMENLNQKLFKDMPVFLPSVGEQDEIVRRVQDLHRFADRLETRYAKAKAHVDRVTQSLLAKAFRGELVPTEAELARRDGREYETAEELLARIKQGQTTTTHRVTARHGRVRRRV